MIYQCAGTMKRPHTERFLRWQVNKLKAKHDHFSKYWETKYVSKCQMIEQFKTKVETLQEKVEAASRREKELEDQLVKSQHDLKNYIWEIDDLECILNRKQKLHKESQEEFDRYINRIQKDHKTAVAEALEEKEKSISCMQENFDRKLALQKETADKALIEQAASYEHEIEKLKEQFSETVRVNKGVVKNLKKQLVEKDDFIEKQQKQMEAVRLNSRMERVALELKLEKKEQTITLLKKQPNLTQTVAKLNETVKAKDNVIKQKDQELAHLKREKNAIQDDWQRETDNNAILLIKLKTSEDNCTRLEEENKEQESKYKEKVDELNKIQLTNGDLTESVAHLRYRVRAFEPDLTKLKDKVKTLEVYQLRFKEDLQACISVIGDPNTFRKRIICLKRRYIDGDEMVQMDAETREVLLGQIENLKNKISSSERIQQNYRNELRRAHEQIEKAAERFDQTRNHFIKLVNDKTVELHRLKKDLEQTTLQLLKAKKPAQHKVRSWINKKVFRNAKPGQQLAEEPPSLYSEDWQPELSRITSSGTTCTDETSSSSSQVPLDDIVTYVKPFVDDGMPPVDI